MILLRLGILCRELPCRVADPEPSHWMTKDVSTTTSEWTPIVYVSRTRPTVSHQTRRHCPFVPGLTLDRCLVSRKSHLPLGSGCRLDRQDVPPYSLPCVVYLTDVDYKRHQGRTFNTLKSCFHCLLSSQPVVRVPGPVVTFTASPTQTRVKGTRKWPEYQYHEGDTVPVLGSVGSWL